MRRTLALVWRSSRPLTLALMLLTLVGAAVPPAIAYVGKHIVDAVVARSAELALRWVIIELALVATLASVQRGLSLVRIVLGARLGIDINVNILDKALGLDLEHFEDSEFYDKLTRARREASSRPVALVTDAFQLVQHVLTLAGYAALLVRFSPWAALGLLVATVPATLAEMRYSKAAFRLRNWRSPESRRLMYLEHVLANDRHAKEVKLFGIGSHLLDRYKLLAEQFYREDRKLAVKRTTVTHALSLLATSAFYAAYAAVALLAAAGKLSLGDMTLYVLAFRQGQQSFQSALGSIGSIYEHNLYLSNLFEYLAVAGRDATLAAGSDAGGGAGAGIVFENVGFRYPGKEEWALRSIDLAIARGESVALVGENGAGKTTLIKLLTRLYEPTEGRILLDGRDLKSWQPDALRRRIGVIFQDFNQYQLRVRENVGFGSVEHLDSEPRLERAVERGGAASLVSSLPAGLDAPLGRWFADGSELSGGQWQKIALARAFMREEADILVLDEPTAALDAQAEHAVFERFRELASTRTTLVISHRFPTVRMAERIIVLERGQIVEMGGHDELVAKGGRYARMFALQAEGYR
ncbi:MAG TPA: ABC transporter ATP-binding protein [Polyangiaceae bacterium]|nr:ABC transporter ATP-binding protein [Polyangiaceae bacterium]